MISSSLKALRLKQGLKQEWVCSQTGISQPHLSHIEQNKRELTLDNLIKLCDFYGVPNIEDVIVSHINQTDATQDNN